MQQAKKTVVADNESGFFSELPKAWKSSTTFVVSTQQLKATVFAEVLVSLRKHLSKSTTQPKYLHQKLL